MLQIVNKDIFFRSFFQKHEKKRKNQSNEISRGAGVWTMSFENFWREGVSPDAPKLKFLAGGMFYKNSPSVVGVWIISGTTLSTDFQIMLTLSLTHSYR